MNRRNRARIRLILTILAWVFMLLYCLTVPTKPDEPEPLEVSYPTHEELARSSMLFLSDLDKPAAEPEPVIVLQSVDYIKDCTITFYCVCEECCGKTPDDPTYGITVDRRGAWPPDCLCGLDGAGESGLNKAPRRPSAALAACHNAA